MGTITRRSIRRTYELALPREERPPKNTMRAALEVMMKNDIAATMSPKSGRGANARTLARIDKVGSFLVGLFIHPTKRSRKRPGRISTLTWRPA